MGSTINILVFHPTTLNSFKKINMRKNILLILLLIVATISIKAQSVYNYGLSNVNNVEYYQKYVGKILYYIPEKGGLNFGSKALYWGDMQAVTIKSIEGKNNPKKEFQKMKWTVENAKEGTVVLTVYSGNYSKETWGYKNQYLVQYLRFFDLDAWKAEKSSEYLSKTFTNPLVKASYKVIDFAFGRNPDKYKSSYDSDYYTVNFTVENSLSGEKLTIPATSAQTDCFTEDISGRYYSYLFKVEKPSAPAVKFGKTTTIEDEKDKGITKFSYEDNFINIIIFGTSEQFNFTLKNVSQNTEKLVWNDAVFVDYAGSTSKVMHNGIKYSQREADQPASSIIRGASLDDLACPTSNVYYSDILKKWMTNSMYPKTPFKEVKQVSLMLPIQIKDVVNEYIFVFDLKYEYKHPERLNLQ